MRDYFGARARCGREDWEVAFLGRLVFAQENCLRCDWLAEKILQSTCCTCGWRCLPDSISRSCIYIAKTAAGAACAICALSRLTMGGLRVQMKSDSSLCDGMCCLRHATAQGMGARRECDVSIEYIDQCISERTRIGQFQERTNKSCSIIHDRLCSPTKENKNREVQQAVSTPDANKG
jgi:hypothetical protein